MVDGFMFHIRGIRIDVKKTMDKFYKDKKESYYVEDFIKYLELLGLNSEYNKSNYDVNKPMNDGFISILLFDEPTDFDKKGDDNCVFLVTGIWHYQDWVLQRWTDTKEQLEFFNPKYLSKTIETSLKNNWNNKLIFMDNEDKLAIYAIGDAHDINFNKSVATKEKDEFRTTLQKGGSINVKDTYIQNKIYYKFIKNIN